MKSFVESASMASRDCPPYMHSCVARSLVVISLGSLGESTRENQLTFLTRYRYYRRPENSSKQRLRVWPESMCMEFRAKSFVCYEVVFDVSWTENGQLTMIVQKFEPGGRRGSVRSSAERVCSLSPLSHSRILLTVVTERP